MKTAGFKTGRLPLELQQDMLRISPWRDLLLAHLYVCEKITARPAVSVTDVKALIALDARNTIIHFEILALRVGL